MSYYSYTTNTGTTCQTSNIEEVRSMMRRLSTRKEMNDAAARFQFKCEPCSLCDRTMQLSDDGNTLTVCPHQMQAIKNRAISDQGEVSPQCIPSLGGLRIELADD